MSIPITMARNCVVCNVDRHERQTFCLPKSKSRAIVWLDVLGLPKDNLQPICGRMRVCSNHFEENCFTNGTRSKLNRSAIPSLLLTSQSPTKKNEVNQSGLDEENHDIQTSNKENTINSSLQVLDIQNHDIETPIQIHEVNQYLQDMDIQIIKDSPCDEFQEHVTEDIEQFEQDDYTTKIEWTNKCIACLKDEVQVEKISSLSILSGFKELFQYLGIEDLKNENLHDYVCANCVLQMHSMLYFKKQCEESQTKLKLLTSTSRDEKIHISSGFEDQIEIVENKIELTRRLSSPSSLPETTMHVQEELHLNSYATPDDQNFDSTSLQEICVSCKGKFPDKIWLQRHQILKHGLNDCIEECSRCKLLIKRYNKKFEYLLKFHQDFDHENKCGACRLNFKSIFHLAQHNVLLHTSKIDEIDNKRRTIGIYETHNKRRKKLIACPTCNKVFVSKNLRQHIRRHDPNRTKNLCTICKKSVYYLRQHLKTHLKAPRQKISNPTPIPKDALCVHCGKFYGRYCLEQHIIGVHYGIKNYECNYCNKMFTTNTERRSHVNRVHFKLKRFPCSQCDKKFFFRASLKVHIRKHTGERPYKCPYCDLSLRGNLKRHIRQKHGF